MLKTKLEELTNLNKKIVESQLILIDLIENNNENVNNIKNNMDEMKKLYLKKENNKSNKKVISKNLKEKNNIKQKKNK